MQPRQSLIAVGPLVAAALVLALAACGGDSGKGAEEGSQAPTTTTSPPADPLEGKWRAELTCRDSVRALERRLSPKQIWAPSSDAPGTTLQSVLRGFGGTWSDAKPTDDDPCDGAPGTVALIARFVDGNLAFFDAGGELGLQARYELVGDHAIRVDAEDLCAPSCPTWKFELVGDELTVRIHPPNPYGVASWEAAPFVRVG